MGLGGRQYYTIETNKSSSDDCSGHFSILEIKRGKDKLSACTLSILDRVFDSNTHLSIPCPGVGHVHQKGFVSTFPHTFLFSR